MKKALLIGINDYPAGNELRTSIALKPQLNDMVMVLLILA